MSETVLNQDHVASSPWRFSQLKKLESGKKCWQSALKLLSYPCSFCSSTPKSERVMWFILKIETSLDPQVSRAKTISSHHLCLAWEQNVAPVGVSVGDWCQEERRGSFMFIVVRWWRKVWCVCGIGKCKLKPEKRRDWLGVIGETVPGCSTFKVSADSSSFFLLSSLRFGGWVGAWFKEEKSYRRK